MAQIVVPTLGESVSEATVARWLKKEGETVKADEPLVELETDKVTLEVNAPQGGTVTRIIVGEGTTVKVGAVLGELGEASGAANDTAKAVAPPEAKQAAKDLDKPPATPVTTNPAGTQGTPTPGPAARKAAADAGVDISGQSGSGKDGRMTKADVANLPPMQAVGTHQVPGGDKPGTPPPAAATTPRQTGPPRRISPRRTRQDDAPAPAHRGAPEGSAEHGGDADHL